MRCAETAAPQQQLRTALAVHAPSSSFMQQLYNTSRFHAACGGFMRKQQRVNNCNAMQQLRAAHAATCNTRSNFYALVVTPFVLCHACRTTQVHKVTVATTKMKTIAAAKRLLLCRSHNRASRAAATAP